MGCLAKGFYIAVELGKVPPLSHAFSISNEPLHMMFKKAQEYGILSNLSRWCDKFRVSLYEDGVAIFLKPTENDLKVTIDILNIFVEASGLTTNMTKTECYPTQCANTNLEFSTASNLVISHFLCMYLGLPLHYKKPSKTMLQPVIDKIGNKLPGWKKLFFTYSDREILVKFALSNMLTYFLTLHKMPKWGLSRLDSFKRCFIWKGLDPDRVRGGHYLVNRRTCVLPKRYGDLVLRTLKSSVVLLG
jgi:hypothetical protein